MVGLAIGGLEYGGLDGECRHDRRGWDDLDQEVVPGQAGVAVTAFGVQDPEGRPPTCRAVSVMGDEDLRALTDDVPAQADPPSTGQLQADAGRLVHRGRKTATEPRRIEDEEQRLRAPGEGGQPAEPIRDPGRGIRAGQPATGQIEDEQVHRPTGEQAPGDGKPLVQAGRGDDDEPFEAHAARHGLDGVEGP